MNWQELIKKNRKTVIGLVILAILLILLIFVMMVSKISKQINPETQTTDQTKTQTTITVSSTTPKNDEKNTYLDESIIITLDQDITAENLILSISPQTKFKVTEQSAGVFVLDPELNLKPNQIYKIELQFQGEEIFNSTQNNKYLFSFTTGNKLRNEVLKNITK